MLSIKGEFVQVSFIFEVIKDKVWRKLNYRKALCHMCFIVANYKNM